MSSAWQEQEKEWAARRAASAAAPAAATAPAAPGLSASMKAQQAAWQAQASHAAPAAAAAVAAAPVAAAPVAAAPVATATAAGGSLSEMLAKITALETELASASERASASPSEAFDIGAYRAERLAATPPNIIECAEAGEGGSQEACHLPAAERFSALGQKGITLWMTGLSGSGKSTIAGALEEELVLTYGKHVQMLDGDNVRTGLNRDLGFSPDDRAESVRRVGEMACLFNGGGVITLVTLVSP